MPRVVLVTGCSAGGIGYALAQEFAKQGCIVYATSRRVETIADFADSRIHKLALDVTSEENVQNVIQEIISKERNIDVVVNNAGIISAVFDTDTFAILRVARAVIPEMAKRKQGVIVNIGSLAGEVATPWNGIYCASKAAAHSLSQVLAMECRPLGIKVLHVAPGAVKSNIADTGASNFSLPANSLYGSFLANIMDRIYYSQGPGTMPTEVFAKRVVANTLRKNPRFYISLGGHWFQITILKWLPVTTTMGILWRRYSKRL